MTAPSRRALMYAVLVVLIVQLAFVSMRSYENCLSVTNVSDKLVSLHEDLKVASALVDELSNNKSTASPTAAPTTSAPTPTPLRPEQIGVDPIYLHLLTEAERRSSEDFATEHQLGERGIVIGPTEGDFLRHSVRAFQNARRIRHILGDDRSIKLAWMSSQEHIDIFHKCATDDSPDYCYLYMNGTLFDHIIPTTLEYQPNDDHTLLVQGPSTYWLKALAGYRHAPYKATLFLDSDAYPCPGFDKLFAIVDSTMPHKSWQLPFTGDADFAAGVDQFPFGTGHPKDWLPGDPNQLTDYFYFPERNTGTVLFYFKNKVAHDFAHFIPLVSEHVYNNVATVEKKVVNDQCPFKIAMYLFQRLRPDFRHHQIPMHSSCRSYPGVDYTGTDAFESGMLPLLPDGQRCRDCDCTPCLVSHCTALHYVMLNGQLGWEPDFTWDKKA